MSGKYFPKSLTCVKDKRVLRQRETIFTDLDLDCATWNKKNYGFCLNCVIAYFLPISPCNTGINFQWWTTCFDQASQYPSSLFFASLSWHRKLADSPFFEKTWQWLWGSFYWSCGKLQCVQSGYYIQASWKWLPLSSPKHLLPFAYYVLAFNLEYCAFNQHWHSVLTSQLDRRVLTCFVTDTSACNLEKDSFNLHISTSTLLFTTSSFIWSNRIIGIRSFLLIHFF